MAKRLIPPLIILLVLVGALVYVGSTRWVELRILPAKPDEISNALFAMSLQASVLLLTGVIAAVIALWSLFLWIWRLPRKMKTGIGRRRKENGLEALEQALIAAETGANDKALKKARKAHELLNRPALTHLISARTSELTGDLDDADAHYRALLDDEQTAAAGYRGLAQLSMARGDFASAAQMASAAFDSDAAPEWAFDLLFRAQIALGDWQDALSTLDRGKKLKTVDHAVQMRRRAVVLSALASRSEADRDFEAALSYANQALAASAGFAPAAALAARLYQQAGQPKKAIGVIEKAWKHAPHPALSQAYKDIFVGEKPANLEKRIRHLAKLNPEHRESAIFLAEHHLAQKDGVSALQDLSELLVEETPSARVCELAAQAETLLGNDVDAKAWAARAKSAPLEPNWSDLDPDGPAFAYSEADWKNLVLSYGETGELIHPRFGAKPRKPVGANVDIGAKTEFENSQSDHDAPAPEQDEPPTPPSPDNPGVLPDTEKGADLSSRLEKLLGEKGKN